MSDIRTQINKLGTHKATGFLKSIIPFIPGERVYYFPNGSIDDKGVHVEIKSGIIGHGFAIYENGKHVKIEIEGETGLFSIEDIIKSQYREDAIIEALEYCNYKFNEDQTEILISEV